MGRPYEPPTVRPGWRRWLSLKGGVLNIIFCCAPLDQSLSNSRKTLEWGGRQSRGRRLKESAIGCAFFIHRVREAEVIGLYKKALRTGHIWSVDTGCRYCSVPRSMPCRPAATRGLPPSHVPRLCQPSRLGIIQLLLALFVCKFYGGSMVVYVESDGSVPPTLVRRLADSRTIQKPQSLHTPVLLVSHICYKEPAYLPEVPFVLPAVPAVW